MKTNVVALGAALCLTFVAGRADAQRRTVDVVPFGSPGMRGFHPDLGSARDFLDGRVRDRYPGLYRAMNLELQVLEDRQTTSDWILWPGTILGIGSLGTGLGLVFAAADDDEYRIAGVTLLAVGVVIFIAALITSAAVRPTEQDLRRIFVPVLGEVPR